MRTRALYEIRCHDGHVTSVVSTDEPWVTARFCKHPGCDGTHTWQAVPSKRCAWGSCHTLLPVDGAHYCPPHGWLHDGIAARTVS